MDQNRCTPAAFLIATSVFDWHRHRVRRIRRHNLDHTLSRRIFCRQTSIISVPIYPPNFSLTYVPSSAVRAG